MMNEDWNEFLYLLGNGTTDEKANYNSWMQRHLSKCQSCPACPGRDPFVN